MLVQDAEAAVPARYRMLIDASYARAIRAGDFLYSQVYSFDPNGGWSLWREADFLSGIGSTVLPFSDNGGGDYLAFKVIDGKCTDRVYWLDHELDYSISDSEYEDFNTWIAEFALKA